MHLRIDKAYCRSGSLQFSAMVVNSSHFIAVFFQFVTKAFAKTSMPTLLILVNVLPKKILSQFRVMLLIRLVFV